MKIVRILFAAVLVLSLGSAVAQESKIVKLLNDQLQKELKQYPDPDSLVVLRPFEINDKKELTVKFKRTFSNTGESEITTTTVHLSKIKSLVKDINVLFETEENAVILVTSATTEDGTVKPDETSRGNLFFTGINKDTNNEKFRDKLLAAFKKAGYKIDSTFWAD